MSKVETLYFAEQTPWAVLKISKIKANVTKFQKSTETLQLLKYNTMAQRLTSFSQLLYQRYSIRNMPDTMLKLIDRNVFKRIITLCSERPDPFVTEVGSSYNSLVSTNQINHSPQGIDCSAQARSRHSSAASNASSGSHGSNGSQNSIPQNPSNSAINDSTAPIFESVFDDNVNLPPFNASSPLYTYNYTVVDRVYEDQQRRLLESNDTLFNENFKYQNNLHEERAADLIEKIKPYLNPSDSNNSSQWTQRLMTRFQIDDRIVKAVLEDKSFDPNENIKRNYFTMHIYMLNMLSHTPALQKYTITDEAVDPVANILQQYIKDELDISLITGENDSRS